MHILEPQFFVILTSRAFQPSCCISSLISVIERKVTSSCNHINIDLTPAADLLDIVRFSFISTQFLFRIQNYTFYANNIIFPVRREDTAEEGSCNMADNRSRYLKMARLLAFGHILIGVLLFILGIVDRVHGYFWSGEGCFGIWCGLWVSVILRLAFQRKPSGILLALLKN